MSFAILIALLIAFKKLLIVGLIAIGAGIKKLFGLKKEAPAQAAAATASPPASSGVAEQHPGEGGPGGQHGA